MSWRCWESVEAGARSHSIDCLAPHSRGTRHVPPLWDLARPSQKVDGDRVECIDRGRPGRHDALLDGRPGVHLARRPAVETECLRTRRRGWRHKGKTALARHNSLSQNGPEGWFKHTRRYASLERGCMIVSVARQLKMTPPRLRDGSGPSGVGHRLLRVRAAHFAEGSIPELVRWAPCDGRHASRNLSSNSAPEPPLENSNLGMGYPNGIRLGPTRRLTRTRAGLAGIATWSHALPDNGDGGGGGNTYPLCSRCARKYASFTMLLSLRYKALAKL